MSLVTLWKVDLEYFSSEAEAIQHVTEYWDPEENDVPRVKSKVIWDAQELCELLNKIEQGG